MQSETSLPPRCRFHDRGYAFGFSGGFILADLEYVDGDFNRPKAVLLAFEERIGTDRLFEKVAAHARFFLRFPRGSLVIR